MSKSSIDRVKNHLNSRGSDSVLEIREDLEMLVRRCDEVRSMGVEFGSVEMSPYMSSLLRVSRAKAERMDLHAPVAASV